MRNLIIAIVVIVIVAAAAYYFFGRGSSSQTPKTTPTVTTVPSTSSATPSSNGKTTITAGDSGFSPDSVTVKSGDTVTWMNNSSQDVEVGANPHPIHTGNKEVSGGEFVLKLAPGESKTVTVTKVGTFGYHNHLDPSKGGSITVE